MLRNPFFYLARITGLIALVCMLPLQAFPVGSHKAAVSETVVAGESEEVYLSFRYRGVGNVIVVALYKDGQFFLPVSELFSHLMVNHSVEMADNRLVIRGFYLKERDLYEIDFTGQVIQLGHTQRQLTASDQLIGELDYYLHPKVFEDIFGLVFSVDMNNLQLRLETPDKMPVVERLERQSARGNMREYQLIQEDYPLMYDRQRHRVGGAFFDYSVSGNLSEVSNIYNYNFTGGAELLGGDIQGSVYGTLAGDRHFYRTGNLRWRYIVEDRPWLTRVKLGQLNSNGLVNRNYRGVHLSNDPIEPRRLYDEHQIQGMSAPRSEIEVYLNSRLIEYTTADELGNYDFTVPLTYGSARLRMVMYNPDGSTVEVNRRIQIPYTFLPPGELSYSFNAGLMDYALIPGQEHSMIVHSNAAYGLTNWLTGKAGVEYLEGANMERPLFYNSFSARLATQYLINVDLAPDAFYRMRTSIVYPNSMAWGIGYTYYTQPGGIYNRSGNEQDLNANLFLPFMVNNQPMGLRFSGTHRILTSGSTSTQVRADAHTRVSRANFRLGYRETISARAGSTIRSDANLTSTVTYTIPRRSTLPQILAGTYLRARVDYRLGVSRVERLQTQLSKTIWRAGRLQVSYERNFIGTFNTLEVGFTYDFNSTRNSTTARYSRGAGSIRTNLRGSIGYDASHNQVLFDNRQQVGRSAASVRMFIDKNNTGVFDDGDEIIPDNAIRLRRAGARSIDTQGITRITQLQAYQRHNIEINQSAIRNPSLVPKFTEFSFVGDPNSYKTIDIPFYIAGIVEGRVMLIRGANQAPLGGLRVNLKQKDGDFHTVMRTFSDGGFYAMDIPPGIYEARVDSSQLTFLSAVSEPEVLEFEVVSMERGDLVEGLNFRLIDTRELAVEARPEGYLDTEEDGITEEKKNLSVYYLQAEYDGEREPAERFAAHLKEILDLPFESVAGPGGTFLVQLRDELTFYEADKIRKQLEQAGIEKTLIIPHQR